MLEAFGINPTKVHSTGAAVLHSQWLKEGYGGVEGRRAMEEGECGEYPDSAFVPTVLFPELRTG